MKTIPPLSFWKYRASFLCIFLVLSSKPIQSEMLYHIPFDQGGTQSYENFGTIGGVAQPKARQGGTRSNPLSAEEAPPGLGGSAEDFSVLSHKGQVGPGICLPESENQLQLNTDGDQITIAAWVRFQPGSDKRQIIVSKASLGMETPSGSGWAFMARNSGALQFALMGGITPHTDNITDAKLQPAQWHHVAVTAYVGAHADCRYYIDGEEVFCGRPRLGKKAAINNSHPISLAANIPAGRRDIGFSYPFGGALDDVAIWNTVLDAEKIRVLAALPSVLPGANAGVVNELFTIFDTADEKKETPVHGYRWRYSSNVQQGRNHRGIGEEGGLIYLPFNLTGAGLIGSKLE